MEAVPREMEALRVEVRGCGISVAWEAPYDCKSEI